MLAVKGDWVLIEQVFLAMDQRDLHIPQDTKATDFKLRIKGFLIDEKCVFGEDCFIETKTGRVIKGSLIDIMPEYHHSFGHYLPQTAYIERQLRDELTGGSDE